MNLCSNKCMRHFDLGVITLTQATTNVTCAYFFMFKFDNLILW
jgi:hypothetical protein